MNKNILAASLAIATIFFTNVIVLAQMVPISPPMPAANNFKPVMMKLTSNYIVRNLNGDQVCNLAKGAFVAVTGIAPDSERVQIVVPEGPCAGVTNGFVYLNYLRPAKKSVDRSTEMAFVDTHGLSLRREPSVEDGTFRCSLPKNTKIGILDEVHKRSRWVQVLIENPPRGCPDKGWVAASYLKPDLDVTRLPKVQATVTTEARVSTDCTECDQTEVSGGKVSEVKKISTSAKEIENLVNAPQSKTDGVENPFTSFLKDLQLTQKCPSKKNSDYKCNRGLVQMPADGNAGFCGTHHYSPDRPAGVDAYAAPHAACSLAAVAQEWKKTTCPDDNAGCRIAWGDISHATKPLFSGHREHTRGECIDIRPFNKGKFRDAGRNVNTSDYDRETTVAFLKLVKKFGGNIRYSDRKISNSNKNLGIAWGGAMHNNHIHVCFGAGNSTVKNSCNNLKVDPTVCSELQ